MSDGSTAAVGKPAGLPRPRRDGDLRPTDVVALFFICGIGFLVAGAVAAMVQAASPWPWGRWLALHLIFVGGISQLVLGASQFFAAAFLATDPPPRALIRAQLATWNAGTVLLLVATTQSWPALRWIAIALLFGGLTGWLVAIQRLRSRALRRFSWATRWYLTCVALLALGVLLGALMAAGNYRPFGLDGANLLAAHMTLNLCGWFGGAIVGTLHTFFPSLTGTQLGYPRLQAPTFYCWNGGVLLLAFGYGAGIDAAAVIGWLSLCGAAGLLTANMLSSLRRAARPLSLPALLLGAAQPLLLAGLAVVAATGLSGGADGAVAGSGRDVAGALLVSGWIGLTVLGSLLHLLAVVIRVRVGFTARMPDPRPAFDALVTALAVLGVCCLAISKAVELPISAGLMALPLIAAYLVLGTQIAFRAARILVRLRPRL